MRSSLQRIVVLTQRNLKEILREPLSLVFTVAMPLVMEILFYFVFHNLTAQFEMKYLAPGIVVFSQSFLTLFGGLLIATDRDTSFLKRLYVSKARSFEFIFAYVLALAPIALAQSVLFFVVGGALDPSLFGVGMVLAVLLSMVTSLFFVAMGVLFGSICGVKSIGGVASVVIVGQSVLSGMWFPLEGLGEGIVKFMNALPFRNATTVVTQVACGQGNVLLPLAVVVAYSVAAFVCAVVAFQSKMREN